MGKLLKNVISLVSENLTEYNIGYTVYGIIKK